MLVPFTCKHTNYGQKTRMGLKGRKKGKLFWSAKPNPNGAAKFSLAGNFLQCGMELYEEKSGKGPELTCNRFSLLKRGQQKDGV